MAYLSVILLASMSGLNTQRTVVGVDKRTDVGVDLVMMISGLKVERWSILTQAQMVASLSVILMEC